MQGGLPHYRFDQPNRTWELPNRLVEVSGIAFTGPLTLALIQDERGLLYSLDLEGGSDIEAFKFGPKGDYESLARAGERLLVLRSDGGLLELDFQGSARSAFTNPFEGLPYKDFESAAFDPAHERWLVLAKDTVSDDERKNDDRVIFEIGFHDLALAAEPALVLSRKEIIQAATGRGWPLPTRTSKKGKVKSDFEFRPSDLAVHPITGDYFIVSSRDRTLIAVSPAGELLGTATFPKRVLFQPEGLAFHSNGDLLIASEGVRGKDGKSSKRPAVLLRFSFKAQ